MLMKNGEQKNNYFMFRIRRPSNQTTRGSDDSPNWFLQKQINDFNSGERSFHERLDIIVTQENRLLLHDNN